MTETPNSGPSSSRTILIILENPPATIITKTIVVFIQLWLKGNLCDGKLKLLLRSLSLEIDDGRPDFSCASWWVVFYAVISALDMRPIHAWFQNSPASLEPLWRNIRVVGIVGAFFSAAVLRFEGFSLLN